MKMYDILKRKVHISCLVILSVLLLTGCSPKLDTSSKSAYVESLQKIGNKLDRHQKRKIIKVITFYASNKRPDKLLSLAFTGNIEASALINISELNGLTYDEIMKKYAVDYEEYQTIILKERTKKELSEAIKVKLSNNEFEEAYRLLSSSNTEILDSAYIDFLKLSIDDSKQSYEEKQEYFKN